MDQDCGAVMVANDNCNILSMALCSNHYVYMDFNVIMPNL